MRMNLLGMLPFTAPYLAWVLLTLSALLGSPLETDLVSFDFFFVCDCGFRRLGDQLILDDPPKYCITYVRNIYSMYIAHSDAHLQSECHHYGRAVAL